MLAPSICVPPASAHTRFRVGLGIWLVLAHKKIQLPHTNTQLSLPLSLSFCTQKHNSVAHVWISNEKTTATATATTTTMRNVTVTVTVTGFTKTKKCSTNMHRNFYCDSSDQIKQIYVSTLHKHKSLPACVCLLHTSYRHDYMTQCIWINLFINWMNKVIGFNFCTRVAFSESKTDQKNVNNQTRKEEEEGKRTRKKIQKC